MDFIWCLSQSNDFFEIRNHCYFAIWFDGQCYNKILVNNINPWSLIDDVDPDFKIEILLLADAIYPSLILKLNFQK